MTCATEECSSPRFPTLAQRRASNPNLHSPKCSKPITFKGDSFSRPGSKSTFNLSATLSFSASLSSIRSYNVLPELLARVAEPSLTVPRDFGRITACNARCAELFESSVDEMVGKVGLPTMLGIVVVVGGEGGGKASLSFSESARCHRIG